MSPLLVVHFYLGNRQPVIGGAPIVVPQTQFLIVVEVGEEGDVVVVIGPGPLEPYDRLIKFLKKLSALVITK